MGGHLVYTTQQQKDSSQVFQLQAPDLQSSLWSIFEDFIETYHQFIYCLMTAFRLMIDLKSWGRIFKTPDLKYLLI